MKKTALLVITLFTVFSCAASAQTQAWKAFKEKGIEAIFPNNPEFSTETVNSAIGDLKMDFYMYETKAEEKDLNVLYGLIYTEYPDTLVNSDNKESMVPIFRGAVDGAVNNVKGKLLSEKNIELDGYPGRDVKIGFQGESYVMNVRAYIIKNKMYILQTIADAKNDNNANAKKYFDSFKISK